MNWYLARIHTTPETSTKVIENDKEVVYTIPSRSGPAVLRNGVQEMLILPGSLCHCYDFSVGTVLVGLHAQYNTPGADWTPLSLEQAKDHFMHSRGRPPFAQEVF